MAFFGKDSAERDRRRQEALKRRGNLPEHVAIIMDGNGRWALKHGRQRAYGHAIGIQSVRTITESCAELGIAYLTLYTFSTENWNRPQSEVNAIMDLLVKTIRSELDTLMKNNVRLNVIGEMERLPDDCRLELEHAIDQTSGNTGLTLTLAISYSGRWELVETVRRIANDALMGKLDPADIDESTIERHLATAGMPDPDLLIRTGGDLRISNFLLWQIAYAEIFVAPITWPEFRRRHLYRILKNFQDRERRFGRLNETAHAVSEEAEAGQ